MASICDNVPDRKGNQPGGYRSYRTALEAYCEEQGSGKSFGEALKDGARTVLGWVLSILAILGCLLAWSTFS